MASAVVYQKQIDGSYYVVQAVPDIKKRTTYIVSAYMQKNEGPKIPVASSDASGAHMAQSSMTPRGDAKIPIAPNGVSGSTQGTASMHSPLGNSISPNAENSNRTAENIQSKKRNHPSSDGSSNSPFGSGAHTRMISDNSISPNAGNSNTSAENIPLSGYMQYGKAHRAEAERWELFEA